MSKPQYDDTTLTYEAHCQDCQAVTMHQGGTCLACSPNFPRTPVIAPVEPQVVRKRRSA